MFEDIKPKEGMRVRLIQMGPDPDPIPNKTEGTIRRIDGIGQIHVDWDNRRTLALDPNIDKFELLPNDEDQIDIMSHLGESGGPITKKYTTDLKKAFNSTKPKVKIKTEVKKVKKSKKDLEEMDAGGSGGLAGAAGYSYSAPLSYKTTKKESVIIKFKDLVKEETTTYNTDYTDGTDAKIWADKNKDGWYWNDKPIWEGGEIVDLLAKIQAVWDDENLDISSDWNKVQEKVKKDKLTESERKRIHTNKWDRCVKDVEEKNKKNGTDYKPEAVCTDSLGYKGSILKKHRKKEDIEETTTFGSVWGVNGPPVGPAFVAKKGKHIPSKKPIWKGGQIIQKIENDGVLNETKSDLFTEINKVKFSKGAKYVKIKDRCAKYNNQPWCSQGAIDKPLELSDNTFENIKNISEKTGLTEKYILDAIVNIMNEDTHHKLSLMDKLKIKIAGIDDEQVIYNLNNNLPIDWRGTKEGYYEKMKSTKFNTGSN
jgi:hypothetical protein